MKHEALRELIEFECKQLLLCGGAVGHLQHLWDNKDLTFGEVKDVIAAAAEGKLEKSSEKLDGMNLMFSYNNLTNVLVAARSSGDISRGGMTARELASKFAGRGNVEQAFNTAFKVLHQAISSLPDSTRTKVFGPNSNRWYSIEVIYTANPNTINYDSNNIVFHGWPVFQVDRSGKVGSAKDDRGVSLLTANIDRMQKAVSIRDWKVRGPALVALKKLSDGSVQAKTLAKIDAVMSGAGVSDGNTMLDFLRSALSEDVADLGLPKNAARAVIDRIVGAEGALTVNQIKKMVKPEQKQAVQSFIKASPALAQRAFEPIEVAISEFATEVLRGLESTLIASSQAEVERLRSQVTRAIATIKSSGNKEAMTILNREMAKLGNVENIAAAMEGIVFFYKGQAYKFTGSFAPVNQILGMFKYGRGSAIPPMNVGD